MLRFGPSLAATQAEAFVERTLVGRLAAREVWVGPGFRFGHGRKGDIALLHALGQRHGFDAREVAPLETAASASVPAASAPRSPTAISPRRRPCWDGPFLMGGHVVRGLQLGRKLGYPTANLRVAPRPRAAAAASSRCACAARDCALARGRQPRHAAHGRRRRAAARRRTSSISTAISTDSASRWNSWQSCATRRRFAGPRHHGRRRSTATRRLRARSWPPHPAPAGNPT